MAKRTSFPWDCPVGAVTGELRYKDDDDVTLSQVRKQISRYPAKETDIPQRLNDIIMKALQPTRSQRYQSAFEMQKDFERFLRKHQGSYGPRSWATTCAQYFATNCLPWKLPIFNP